MGARRHPPELIAQVTAAAGRETQDETAARLKLPLATIKFHQAKATRARRAMAKEQLAQGVEAAVPKATDVLVGVMQISWEEAQVKREVSFLREAREGAMDVLKSLGLAPEKDPAIELTDEELDDRLARLGFVRPNGKVHVNGGA